MKTLTKILSLIVIAGFIACEPNDTVEPTPPSEGDVIEPNVGGPDQPNQAFIDLSTGVATAVAKDSWDLGFSTDANFNVILNYAAKVVARPTDKTNLNEVTSVLVTDEYKAETVVGFDGNIEWIDNPDGNLNETAIAPISATDNDNVVYVINRGDIEVSGAVQERGFLKVKITRQGEGYSVTYGEIDATTYETVTIAKDSKYNFTFFSFDDGVVNVEPEQKLWDLQMTTFTNYTFDGVKNVPYQFKDFSIINYQNVKMASIEVTTEVTYANFSYADAQAITFENDRLGIGSSWRGAIFNPDYTVDYYVKDDIFYVIEDPDGNLYKLSFTRMLCVDASCAGERGHPEFVYELLKDE